MDGVVNFLGVERCDTRWGSGVEGVEGVGVVGRWIGGVCNSYLSSWGVVVVRVVESVGSGVVRFISFMGAKACGVSKCAEWG